MINVISGDVIYGHVQHLFYLINVWCTRIPIHGSPHVSILGGYTAYEAHTRAQKHL